MIEIRKSDERGEIKLDWLHGKYGFSFGEYWNPKNTHFGELIVFNEDLISPSMGFGMHPHKNAEVVSIVLEGALKHQDSEGNSGIIKRGELQRMSAGSGMFHSEFNPSDKETTHSLQIWLKPRELNVNPSYEQKKFDDLPKNKINLLVSGNKSDNSLYINQDAKFLMGEFEKGKKFDYDLSSGKGLYVFIISGKMKIEDKEIETGDSASITEINDIQFESLKDSTEVILIETILEQNY